jgi:4-carboxymuconolactone decarboxylase
LAAAQDIQRFPPIAPDQLTSEQRKWLDEITAPPRKSNPSLPPWDAYIRSPEFARHATGLSEYLRWHTELPPRISEFAILITARHWTQQYEWHSHYPLAIKAGLDSNILADMIVGKRPGNMKKDESALYDLVDGIYRDKNVSDATFRSAVAEFGERGVVDIIGLIGYYDTVSMTLIVDRAEPGKDGVPLLQPLPK